MLRKISAFLVVLLLSCGGIFAETSDLDLNKLTLKQSFDNAESLFEGGHSFTANELEALETLRKSLLAAEESGLALRLQSLILAAKKEAEAKVAPQTQQEAVEGLWKTVSDTELKRRNSENWELIRNIGLTSAIITASSSLILGTLGDAAQNKVQYNPNSDWRYLNAEADYYKSAAYISAALTLLSFIPVIMGELNR